MARVLPAGARATSQPVAPRRHGPTGPPHNAGTVENLILRHRPRRRARRARASKSDQGDYLRSRATSRTSSTPLSRPIGVLIMEHAKGQIQVAHNQNEFVLRGPRTVSLSALAGRAVQKVRPE